MNVTERFDELTKAVAGGKSRREILRLSAAMLGGLALVFRDPDTGLAGEPITVNDKELINRQCTHYSVPPVIVELPINEHADVKPIRSSLCVGVINCKAQKMFPDGLHNISFKDSVACLPIRGASDEMKDAYCPSARDCEKSFTADIKTKTILAVEPKGILAEGVTTPPSEK